MSVLIVLFCILLLILLITWGKLNPFIAFIIVSLTAGLLLGIPLQKITGSVQKGFGDMLGSLVIIIALGAMLGKLVAESGAAQRITQAMLRAFGPKYILWALVTTGFVIGIPLFYNVGFVLMVPLIFSVVYQSRLPAVYVGLPMLASLSVTHGFLPPHPSPVALVGAFNANMGTTLGYGILLAIPTILIAGPLFARTLKNIRSVPLETFRPNELPEDQLPSTGASFFSALLPVILLMGFSVIEALTPKEHSFFAPLQFIKDPMIVMLVSLAVGSYLLGLRKGKTVSQLMGYYGDSVKDVAMILLIIGAAGSLKQILVDSGVSQEIGTRLQNLNMSPLVLGWLISALIRVCVGSATVAGLTTAGIIAPLVLASDISPELMALSVGAGSLAFSHVNDTGFWMFKEYFNLSLRDTFRSWTVMESIVAVAGLLGVLLLDLFI
ncbi:MAG TPA: gluconate:H+ symporter [Chitinophagaceae bacterium]|jgi:Gnt-I system high-affinity gluconate transporter|nr:gluconate:H+ symporter [Chitinophagaceae bacterium]